MYKQRTITVGKYDIVFSVFIRDIIKCLGVSFTHYSDTTSFDIGFWLIDFGVMIWKPYGRR